MKDLKSFKLAWDKLMYILTPSQKRWGLVVFFMSLLGSVAELLGVSVMLPYVQVMADPDELRSNAIIRFLFSDLNDISYNSLLLICTLFVVAIYILKNLYLAALSWIRIKYSTKIQREISIRMIRSYTCRGYQFFRTHGVPVLFRGCRESVVGIQSIIYSFLKILAEFLTIICIFLFVIWSDYSMAIAMIVVAAICLFFVLVIFRRRVQMAGIENYSRAAEANKWLLQLFYGIKEVMVMNKKDFYINIYEHTYQRKQKAEIVQVTSQEYPAFLIEALCICGIMLALFLRVSRMDNAIAYIPRLAAFAVAAFRILPSMGRISLNFNSIVFNIPALNEVFDNIKEANDIENVESKQGDFNGHIEDTYLDMECTFSDLLEIKGVTYRYPDGIEEVLSDINIDIKRGDAVAFVGPSGAGKTTLADIILGLLVPESGSVYMDGINIFENKAIWALNVGFVPQSVYLLDDTVRRNIAFGHLDEDIDDEKIWKVLGEAQMEEYIANLPEALDTIVGERGIRFSGGQAQRLAIARALYNDPQILVLDEATSALDNDTESAIMDAINALQGEKTLIIVAHRLTTVKNCDHIYEIRDGKAVERKYEDL